MKKYKLATFLSLSCISAATAQTAPLADDYYKSVLENKQKLEETKSEIIETVLASVDENAKKIEEISNELAKAKPEELPIIHVKLAVLQAGLQVDSLKLQSFFMVKEKDEKAKEKIREKEEQKKHKDIELQLRKEAEEYNVQF